MRSVTSRHNPIAARFRAMAEEADPTGARVLLDGVHLVRDARDSGSSFEVVAVAASRLTSHTEEGLLARTLSTAGVNVVEVPDSVMTSISPVRTPSGIVAIATRHTAATAEICAAPNAFILAAVDVQDPGNVGALVRVAEAGGITGMYVCGASANPFSWKAVRGSMGSVLRLPIVAGVKTPDVLLSMKASRMRVVAAVARGGAEPETVDWSGKVGIVLGGEGPGLSDDVLASCEARVTIPMAPHVESLNVATAGAILVYAARRQRT